MTIFPWIRPHAIRISDENVDMICRFIPIKESDLQELIVESRESETSYYLVTWRRPEDGHGRWIVLTHQEFIAEYEVSPEDDRFEKTFERI